MWPWILIIVAQTKLVFSIFLVSLLPDDNMNLVLEEQAFSWDCFRKLNKINAKGYNKSQQQSKVLSVTSDLRTHLWHFMVRTQAEHGYHQAKNTQTRYEITSKLAVCPTIIRGISQTVYSGTQPLRVYNVQKFSFGTVRPSLLHPSRGWQSWIFTVVSHTKRTSSALLIWS